MKRSQVALWLVGLLAGWLHAVPAHAETYYISPTGSNSNQGTSASPWLTFAHAINPARASCGDVLILKDGIYGDGTGTGKTAITQLECTAGNEFTITAEHPRQAKVVDNGSGVAVALTNTAFIIVDGLVAASTDNSSEQGFDRGRPMEVRYSHDLVIRNNLFRNPNRYANAHLLANLFSKDILVEDNEGYIFHRHCVAAWKSERVTVRRQYCNPRGGRIIPGGGGAQVGGADAVFSMYPCKDCILENSIGDGTTHPPFLNEMNGTFGNNVPMSGSQVLGSICYKCNYGNGIYPNARKPGINYSPQNITVRDVALIDFGSKSSGIRCSDCVNATIDHVSVFGVAGSGNGIAADKTVNGATAAQTSVTITNSMVSRVDGIGFSIELPGYDTWKGNELFSFENETQFRPALPANWGETSAADPGMGSCKVWIPAGSPLKAAGTNGSDIGANILYRYKDGVLTKEPLWDPQTGVFPHGAEDLDGINRVAGESLFDIHKRLNVNTGGCPFPADYASTDSMAPAAPANLQVM